MSQFIRTWKLRIGTVDVTELSMRFSVSKNLKPEPNKATISVRNLSEATRKLIESTRNLTVALYAGYGTSPPAIYVGDVRSASSMVEGPTVVTTVASADKQTTVSNARVNLTLPATATKGDMIKAVGTKLGVGEGNLSTLASTLATKGIGGVATAIYGAANDMMNNVTRASGVEWSVQDGALQLLQQGKALAQSAVRLAPDTGLIGSPSVDAKGVVSVRCLIQADLNPGRLVDVQGAFVKGTYRIEEVTYLGDTHGQDWYADIKGRKLK